MVYGILAEPIPDRGGVNEIQLSFTTADQEQEGLLALTSIKPEPPPAECCMSSGVTVN
jgi:hypothetical protein